MQHTELTDNGNRIPLKAWNAQPGVFSIVGPDSADRARLEARIRSGFGTHFGACIGGFMPRFALYQHTSGATGVIGFRSAAHDGLYLEHYLDLPIEAIVASASGAAVARNAIVEVGQFVVDERDILGSFFRDLVPFLCGEGYEWVCFTATNKIRSLLRKVGFHGLPIAAASEGRVVDTGDYWGSYYDNEPVVIVGSLNDPAGGWCSGWDDLAHVRKAG